MKISPEILSGLIGASGGLAGLLPFVRCSGNCTTCFGCAGIGFGIVLVLIGRKIRGAKAKEETNGRV